MPRQSSRRQRRGNSASWHRSALGCQVPALRLPSAAAPPLAAHPCRGNLFWNGPREHPIGLGDGAGCAAAHPTCNETTLRRLNYFNTKQPALAAGASFPRLLSTSGLGGLARLLRPLPAFGPWAPGGPASPTGRLTNSVPRDRDGASRAAAARDAPGAYVVPLPA